MANQASFHAKISADARQFVDQVNEAAEALQALVNAQDKAGGAASSGARSKASSAKKEQRGSEKQAEAALDKLHSKQMQNIRKENQARQQGVRKERGSDAMPGPARGFSEEAGLVARRAETEAKVARQLMIQKAATQAAFNEARKIKAERERALALEKKLVDQGILQEGTLKDQERTVENLQRIQKEYSDRKKQQLNRERSIAKANREQLDAMVTGRYALYDMANAYRGIAENALRMARATASTLIKVAEFESAFTAVERAATLEIGTEAFNEVRQSLIDLSREIPVAFDEISEIATLGAQMGIATQDLEGFTEQIAAFSSVTGATIDETAEKFGRISSLANVPTEEFENLASSVLFAGFNAVATEKEILSMAESIAAAAANSGYAADQVIGLATAMASLGIPPEQARGVVLRLFNDINRAVEGTSDKLGGFANVMGTSAESARELFKTDAEGFFTSFLIGLSEVENLTGTLDELGIVNTREINVLQRLSGNMDVYTKSIQDASQSYAEGTALAEIYADTADNLEAKFQRLVNAFDALQAEAAAGFGEALKPLIEGLIDLTTAATEFSKSGLGRSIVLIITGFAALTAAFAGIRFVGSIATAQLLAIRTAVLKMGEAGNVAAKPFSGLVNAISGNVYVTDVLTGRTQFLTKSQIEAAVSSENLSRAQANQILTSQRATVATKALSVSMSLLGGAMAAISIIGIGAMIFQMNKMNNEVGKNVGGVDALARAIEEDTKAYDDGADAIATHTINLGKNTKASKDNADATKLIINAQGNVERQLYDTADAAETATAAIGENFRQLLLQDISQSDAFKNLVGGLEGGVDDVNNLFEALDLNFNDLIDAAAEDPESGAIDALVQGLADAEQRIDNFDPATQKLITDLNRIEKGMLGTNLQINGLEGFALAAAGGLNNLSNGVTGVGTDSIYAAQDIGAIVKSIQDGTFAALEQYEVFKLLGVEVPGTTGVIEDFGDEAEGTEEQVGGLSKSLRTVLDYSSDLGGIFDRIMGIETGQSQAIDDIADSWEKITENASKAEDAIRDANNEILELTADRDVLEYQLSVAERYGDEQRAAVIRAKLAKIDSNLADENQNLANAQEESEMSLDGQTKAARENRSAVIGLIGSYGDLIQAAVDAGMQGQELEDYTRSLKEEFIKQGKEVGFSERALSGLSERFTLSETAAKDFDEELQGLIEEFSTGTIGATEFDEKVFNLLTNFGLGETKAREFLKDLSPLVEDFNNGEISADKFAIKVNKLANEFIGAETKTYDFLGIFDGFIETVEKVDPRVDIRFDSNISAAEQAFDEYMAKLKSANGYTSTQTFETVFKQKVPHRMALSPVIMGSDVRLFRMGLQAGKINLNDYYKAVYGMDYKTFRSISSGGGGSGSSAGEFVVGRASGGYIGTMRNGGKVTGPGGAKSDVIPAMLSNGEYVIQASAVGAYGVDFMNALNQQRVPMGSIGSAGSGSNQGGGSTIVYLSPQDRALLRQVADRPVNLYADNGKIAQSANAGNVTLSQRGLN